MRKLNQDRNTGGESDDTEAALNTLDRQGSFLRSKANVSGVSLKVSDNKTAFCIAFVLFAVISAVGITLLYVFEDVVEDQTYLKALTLAKDSGTFFSEQLDRALLPLFSLAQFATEIDIFRNLPDAVGQAGEEGSLPLISSDDTSWMKRNVTGVCDDPELVERYTKIATNIKKSAKMEGVLVNLQFAPHGVLCLLHPMNNTEDFAEGKFRTWSYPSSSQNQNTCLIFLQGVFMDNSGVWGLDLLNDPAMSFIARQTVSATDVVVAGPRKLMQCGSGTSCDALVEKAFIARLPIFFNDHNITIDGIQYPRWGFAVALINWAKLADESRIFEAFEGVGLHFQLSRTDRILNLTTGTYDITRVILAESPAFESNIGSSFVTVPLQTTNNEWEMTVLYGSSVKDDWHAVVMVAAFVVASMLGVLVYLMLVHRNSKAIVIREVASKQAKLDAEKRITAYFAHELRNPLGAIICALESVPDDISPALKELFDCMKLGSRFMTYIMDNLIEGRKIEEGKMQLECAPLSLEAITNEVYSMLKPSVGKSVDFQVHCSTKGKDRVLGDSHRIKQVLCNILTNAIKYTKSGKISISVTWEGDQVVFECDDEGLGIPKEKQKLLFQRFVQLGDRPGSGLGLSISKQLVDLMGGSIVYDSDPDVRPGTKCTVSLPLPRCSISERSSTSTSSSESSSKPEIISQEMEVLVVDDVAMNRSMLSRRFKKCICPNANIQVCATGESALDICSKSTFTIIIMDQFMDTAGGKLLGSETIATLRLRGIRSFIIGCSGNFLEKEFLDAGADIVWQKPIPDNSEILRQLRSCLEIS